MATSQGYKCEFIDSVFADLYCKKCTLVARRLTITICCGESFCKVCIAGIKEQGKPCPECREKDFTTFEHVKNQKRLNCLQVYCSMKERGCVWSGTLEQLDTHLDHDQDNCQYVDTKCPLNCQQAIPKNEIEQHVAQHCAKRPYVCQHCNFKATYEEVVDTHLPECKYVPLQCPNLCGVTFERDFIEDHMRMCRLEEVGCEFSGAGCDGRFRREDQEEHTRQNSQKHLTLTASLAVETKEQLQQKFLEQDKKHKEEVEKLKKKTEELEKMIAEEEKKLKKEVMKLQRQEKKQGEQQKKQEELEKRLGEQEKQLGEQKKQLSEQEKQLGEQKQKLDKQKQLSEQFFNSKLNKLEQMFKEVVDKSIHNESQLSELTRMTGLNRRFEMKNFSKEKAKDNPDDWKSPDMYTHVFGYKFCIGVDANGSGTASGHGLCVDLWAMSGEYDDQLKWPILIKLTTELVNQEGGKNACYTTTGCLYKPTKKYCRIGWMTRTAYGCFVVNTEINKFLNNDTLYFHVSKIEIL